jgi:hypothetical protein
MGRSFIALVAGFALVGCSTGEVKLGVDVAAIKTAVAADTQSGATAALEVTRVRILVADAKIGYTGGRSGGASAEVGPFVIDLTADEIANGAHREFSLGSLPSGTYGGAEIEIEPLAAGDTTTDAALADFRAAGASVLVDGTAEGKSFEFAGHFLAEQGTDGEVTVDAATPVAIAMTVDPSKWFFDANGALVNPADSAQHATLALAICKSLDTEPQSTTTTGGGRSGGNGGGAAHCVEPATP